MRTLHGFGPSWFVRAARGAWRKRRQRVVCRQLEKQRKAIEQILKSEQAASPFSDLRDFHAIQDLFPERPVTYLYDEYSAWDRACQRVQTMLRRFEGLRNGGKRLLELGAGDAMTGVLFQTYGHAMNLVDMCDWRDPRALGVPLSICDATGGLPFPDEHFDLVYSFNTLEHVLDVARALEEVCRVLRPNGMFYTHFGPLYCSPWGLHAQRFNMPYPQFLFSEEVLNAALCELGNVDLNQESTALQPLNQWRVERYRSLFSDSDVFCGSILTETNDTCLSVIRQYPQCFQGRGLTFEDVTVFALDVCLTRTACGTPCSKGRGRRDG